MKLDKKQKKYLISLLRNEFDKEATYNECVIIISICKAAGLDKDKIAEMESDLY